MSRKSNAVVFIGMTLPSGGILHFAHLGIELSRLAGQSYDFFFASIKNEAHKGFWALVDSEIPRSSILMENDFPMLANSIVHLVDRYEKVLVHTGGGWGQTKIFRKVLKQLDCVTRNRVSLVGTTHSYRHDSWLRLPMSLFQYVIYRLYYRMIVFQCKYAADRFFGGRDLIRRGKGVVIPLGCEQFPISDEIPPALRELNVVPVLADENLFTFVYLAQFRPGKNHKWLVKALAPVLKSHPHARLLLCGGGNDVVYNHVKDLVSTKGLESQILMPGQIPRDAVPWVLKHVNCAIVPSRAETFGHNFLEPMFAGVPVLGTHVGIGQDVIKDGETGYFFDLASKDSLRMAACKLIDDPVATKKMGTLARDMVATRFRHSDVAHQLSEVYQEILEGES